MIFYSVGRAQRWPLHRGTKKFDADRKKIWNGTWSPSCITYSYIRSPEAPLDFPRWRILLSKTRGESVRPIYILFLSSPWKTVYTLGLSCHKTAKRVLINTACLPSRYLYQTTPKAYYSEHWWKFTWYKIVFREIYGRYKTTYEMNLIWLIKNYYMTNKIW